MACMETTQLGTEYSRLAGPQAEDPYPYLARARDTEPVFYSPQFQMWFVTRYDDIAAVLSDPETFSSRDVVTDLSGFGPETDAALAGYRRQPRMLLNMDGTEHAAQRGTVRPAFAPRRVAAMETTVRETAEAVVGSFASDGHADLVSQFTYPLPLTVILRLLGIPAEDAGDLRRWTEDLKELAFSGRTLPVHRRVECARSVTALQRYLENLAAARAAEPGQDIVSDIIRAQRGQAGDDAAAMVRRVADHVQVLIIGGHETTGNAIASTLRLLLADPARWHAVCADPSLIAPAVEEGLRLETPPKGMIRTATRPVTIGGTGLPEGARVFLLFGSGNRDEQQYPEAGEFRLDRNGQPRHLAFGSGPHYCVGAPLARLEARVALEVLARRLPGLRLASGEAPRHVPSLLFRSLAALPVTWERRATGEAR